MLGGSRISGRVLFGVGSLSTCCEAPLARARLKPSEHHPTFFQAFVSKKGGLIACGSSQSGCASFVCTLTGRSKRINRRVRSMIGCAGSAPRPQGIRTATMASAENATDATSRRVRPSRRGPRSENRQPSRPRNRPEWRGWRRLRQTTKKSEESSQQEADAPSKAEFKKAIMAFGQLQTVGHFANDHPAIRSLKAQFDQAKAASDESVLLSKRIRAGQNQIAMHERDLKAARGACGRGRAKHRGCPEELGAATGHSGKRRKKALQERRTQLEHLHRPAAAEASHVAYATQLSRLTSNPGRASSPTFRHGASVWCFDNCVVHRAVACQILEVRVLEESGISPHHRVQVKLKFSFARLISSCAQTLAASQPVTTYAAIIAGSGFLVRHPPCALFTTHEICGRPYDQLQRSEPHGRDSDHGGSELNDELARKWVRLSRVERRGRNGVQVGDVGLERFSQGGSGLASASEGTWHEVVSHARILGIDCGVGTALRRRTQYGRRTIIKNRSPARMPRRDTWAYRQQE